MTVLIVSPIIIILVRNVVATIQVHPMIDDDNFYVNTFQFHFAALLYEPGGESQGTEIGKRKERRYPLSNAAYKRCHKIEANREGKLSVQYM